MDKLHWTPEDHTRAATEGILQATNNNGVRLENATKSIENIGSDINSRLDENTAVLESIDAKEYPTQMEVSMKGISVVTLKGDPGKDPTKEELLDLINPLIPEPIPGHTPTDDELTELIQSLIPEPIKGDSPSNSELIFLIQPLIPSLPKVKDGKTPTKEELLKIIKPLIPKIRQPVDGSPDTPDEVVEKVNQSEKTIKSDKVDGLPGVIKYVENVSKYPTGKGGGSQRIGIKNQGVKVSDHITDLNFSTGLTATYGNNGQVNIVATGGTGVGHTIEDEGTPLTQRTNLNFAGAGVTVTDDAGNDATVVTITSGGGSGDVVGPTSAIGDTVALFDGITGKLIKDSELTLSGTNTGDQDLSGLVPYLSPLAQQYFDNYNLELNGGGSIVFNRDTPSDRIDINPLTGGILAVYGPGSSAAKLDLTGMTSDRDIVFQDASGTVALVGDVTQYTDEMAQDAVGTILTDSAEIDFTYNDGVPSITASIVSSSIDETKLDTSVNASLALADSAAQNTFRTIAVSGQSDVVADSATDTLTLVAGTNITLTTNAGTDTVTIDASGGSGSTNAYAEIPSGTINSSNTAFTLANNPADTDGVMVFLDGVVQYNGTDYTVSGTTITFSSAPATGSTIFAYYNTFTAGGSSTNSTTQTVDFGVSFTDKAELVVTGQAWVETGSEIVAHVKTGTGVDPDEMYLLDLKTVISNLVSGVGFTLTVYSEPEARGTYDVMCVGV